MTEKTIAAMTSSGKDDWETPRWLFEQLNGEFHFTLDPCCTHETAKCSKHYTPQENGLLQDWGGRSFSATRPIQEKLAPILDKLRGYKNAPQRLKNLIQPLWHSCPHGQIRSFFTPTSTEKRKSAFSKAAFLSWTVEKRRESRCSAQ